MSYEDYDDYRYEPTEIQGLEKAIKLDGEVYLDVVEIKSVISNYVQNNCISLLKQEIQNEVMKCIQSSYGAKSRFDDAIKEIMREKFNEVYPDAVENKINEMEKKLKDYSFDWSRDGGYGGKNSSSMSIKDAAKKRVDVYINNELSDSVKKSKEYIEQFSKNYFAKNLFRAMGMMDSMIPQTESNQIQEN